MGNITQEDAYRASDGHLFTGVDCFAKANLHQVKINTVIHSEKVLSKAREIFDIDGGTGGSTLARSVGLICNTQCISIERATQLLVDAYCELPKMAEFFSFLEKEIGADKKI